jgi:hypothetical protein
MTMTSRRVVHLYELMDSACDAEHIHAHSRQLNHVLIIAPHGRRGTKKPSKMQNVFSDKPAPQLTWAQAERYKTRTMSERVNAAPGRRACTLTAALSLRYGHAWTKSLFKPPERSSKSVTD